MKGSSKSRLVGALIVLVSIAIMATFVMRGIKRGIMADAMGPPQGGLLQNAAQPVRPRTEIFYATTIGVSQVEKQPIVAKPSIQAVPIVLAPPVRAVSLKKHSAPTKQIVPAKQQSASSKQGMFRIRIASYLSLSNAQAMQKRLVRAGFSATITQKTIGSKDWYRLSAGPYSSREEARKARLVVSARFKLKAVVFLPSP